MLLLTVFAGLLLFLINPLSLNGKSAFLFASLMMTTILWATEAVHKTWSSIYLLLVFIFCGKTPVLSVISFAWSNTMLLIIMTQILSVGIMNSGIIDGPVENLMRRTSNKLFFTLLLPYLMGVVLIFIIPQAFARVLILGSIYDAILKVGNEKEAQVKQALIFNAFLAVTITYMMFPGGDIVLNLAAINFSGPEAQEALTFWNWAKWMVVPTIVTSAVMLILTRFLFAKDLAGYHTGMITEKTQTDKRLPSSKKILTVLTMIVIIAFWMTESMHGIAPWIPAMAGLLIMTGSGLLRKEDYKIVNIHFLIFLTTAFSIGKVLGQAGITDAIFFNLEKLIPVGNSDIYLPVIAIMTLLLHMGIGSSVATMSVVLPVFIPMAVANGFPSQMITLIVYIMVNIHFLFPFHHATLLIGIGKNYYEGKFMLKTGVVMTFVSLLLVFLLFIPWWKFIGL
ncbi:MAG: SLC13 family permease [Saccharofermentanales bacterium]|jgi:sodium-dependent dicarboxylate transporter 2/3/5